MTTNSQILDYIMSRDPDGHTEEPTEADYANFRNWVLGAYGSDVWNDYLTGNWRNEEAW